MQSNITIQIDVNVNFTVSNVPSEISIPDGICQEFANREADQLNIDFEEVDKK